MKLKIIMTKTKWKIGECRESKGWTEWKGKLIDFAIDSIRFFTYFLT